MLASNTQPQCGFISRYYYTDAAQIQADTALVTLYAAKKYMAPHLSQECVRVLERSLNSSNACVLLTQARLYDEAILQRRCWEVNSTS